VSRLEQKSTDELARAKEFLDIAQQTLEKSLKTTANRLYFAAERAVVAYLFAMEIKVSKKHGSIWNAAKTVDMKWHTLLQVLYDLRLQADYGANSTIKILTKEVISPYISEVSSLLADIEKKIAQKEKEKKTTPL